MPSEDRPLSSKEAPDPARSYGREKPEAESGMGRLDNNDEATPTKKADQSVEAVKNRQDPTHQLNAQDVVNQRAKNTAGQTAPTHPRPSNRITRWPTIRRSTPIPSPRRATSQAKNATPAPVEKAARPTPVKRDGRDNASLLFRRFVFTKVEHEQRSGLTAVHPAEDLRFAEGEHDLRRDRHRLNARRRLVGVFHQCAATRIIR